MKRITIAIALILSLATLSSGILTHATSKTYDTTTLAGKLASVNDTPGLYFSLSDFLQEEADTSDQAPPPSPGTPITPTFVLSSPLDGNSVQPPAVTVNQDLNGAPQNEPAIAVDPNNPNRIVVGSNDYVTRTWSCTINGTPCSELGDAYSGTYYSNNGGATWCCIATDPSNLATLIPGIEHLTGGQYDGGGDPALAFDTQGNVYFAGLGFDRTQPPNTVAVNKGTFDSSGNLHWGPPTFIGQTTSKSILNDKEWIAVDTHATSHFTDCIYVSWTRFIFSAQTGRYIQSPIFVAYSKNGGASFSTPQLVGGPVIYDQGSRVLVGPDGSVYVFWEGSTRLATFNSIWMVKSTDGGKSWTSPVAVADVVDILNPANTAFRVNSFPAADITPSGTLYVAWNSEALNTASSYTIDPVCAFFISGVTSVRANCHAAAVYSKSTDGGGSWTTPLLIFPALDASNRTPVGYPATNPDNTILNAPSNTGHVETFFPSVATAPNGRVYMSAYAADTLSPWQTCKRPATPTAVGRINCLELGNYIHNARLEYAVADLTTNVSQIVSTHPINSRHGFGGGFIGDYTSIAVGSDNVFHAVWTDTNNKQTVTWWFGFEFVPTTVNMQDIATAKGSF